MNEKTKQQDNRYTVVMWDLMSPKYHTKLYTRGEKINKQKGTLRIIKQKKKNFFFEQP